MNLPIRRTLGFFVHVLVYLPEAGWLRKLAE